MCVLVGTYVVSRNQTTNRWCCSPVTQKRKKVKLQLLTEPQFVFLVESPQRAKTDSVYFQLKRAAAEIRRRNKTMSEREGGRGAIFSPAFSLTDLCSTDAEEGKWGNGSECWWRCSSVREWSVCSCNELVISSICLHLNCSQSHRSSTRDRGCS